MAYKLLTNDLGFGFSVCHHAGAKNGSLREIALDFARENDLTPGEVFAVGWDTGAEDGPFDECGYGSIVYTFGDLTEVTSREQATALAESAHGEDGASTTERLDFVRAVEVSLSGATA